MIKIKFLCDVTVDSFNTDSTFERCEGDVVELLVIEKGEDEWLFYDDDDASHYYISVDAFEVVK